jgi:hypothetical protein
MSRNEPRDVLIPEAASDIISRLALIQVTTLEEIP